MIQNCEKSFDTIFWQNNEEKINVLLSRHIFTIYTLLLHNMEVFPCKESKISQHIDICTILGFRKTSTFC